VLARRVAVGPAANSKLGHQASPAALESVVHPFLLRFVYRPGFGVGNPASMGLVCSSARERGEPFRSTEGGMNRFGRCMCTTSARVTRTRRDLLGGKGRQTWPRIDQAGATGFRRVSRSPPRPCREVPAPGQPSPVSCGLLGHHRAAPAWRTASAGSSANRPRPAAWSACGLRRREVLHAGDDGRRCSTSGLNDAQRQGGLAEGGVATSGSPGTPTAGLLQQMFGKKTVLDIPGEVVLRRAWTRPRPPRGAPQRRPTWNVEDLRTLVAVRSRTAVAPALRGGPSRSTRGSSWDLAIRGGVSTPGNTDRARLLPPPRSRIPGRDLGHRRQRVHHGVRQTWGRTSGTGVALHQGPGVGQVRRVYGDYLANAQV